MQETLFQPGLDRGLHLHINACAIAKSGADIEDDALPGYSLIDKMPDEIEMKPKGKARTR